MEVSTNRDVGTGGDRKGDQPSPKYFSKNQNLLLEKPLYSNSPPSLIFKPSHGTGISTCIYTYLHTACVLRFSTAATSIDDGGAQSDMT